MKIIVFGGAGFLGSHVADVLAERGHEVLIYDLKRPDGLNIGQAYVSGDINDQTAVDIAMRGQDIVYNFAGIADIDKAKSLPLDVVRTNILGNVILLDACVKHNIRRFVFASTLYVYSKAGSFYRSSKQASELLIENYNERYGLNFTILRYGSLYGPKANEDNWIYRILKQALIEKKISRKGDGEELRDYIHVYDAARLSVDVLADEYVDQHVIITGAQQIKVKDLMIMIKEMLNNKIELEFEPVASNEHYEMTPYTFNPKLAKRIQGSNYVDLGQGILDLISRIYKDHFPHKKHNGIYVKD